MPHYSIPAAHRIAHSSSDCLHCACNHPELSITRPSLFLWIHCTKENHSFFRVALYFICSVLVSVHPEPPSHRPFAHYIIDFFFFIFIGIKQSREYDTGLRWTGPCTAVWPRCVRARGFSAGHRGTVQLCKDERINC